MINNLIDYLKDKKIIILGFGKEGQSTYRFIRKNLPEQKIYIADVSNKNANLIENDKNVETVFGENYLEDLNEYDIIMKSPGISFAGMDISKIESKIKSQLELLLEYINVKTTIGVTGSKGKSTTSSLIYQVLKEQDKECLLLGNIGVPVFDCIEDMTEETTVVLEMSSHQLEFMKASPNISILLNIYEEHLDHYNSLEEYAEAKMNIGRYQKEEDYFLYNSDNKMIQECLNRFNNNEHRKCAVSFNGNIINSSFSNIYIKDDYICVKDKKLYNINEERELVGVHNLNNIMFVLGVCDILQLDIEKATKTINTFKGLPHRIEYVGKYDDIIFYNDSIATIPEAAMNSVKALKKVNTLIFGGMDRGINYNEFIDFLNTGIVENLICMPDTGYKIADKLDSKLNVYKVENLEEAVSIAKDVTKKDMICLLSPAAASYGFFKNFVEKGEKYKEIVRKKV